MSGGGMEGFKGSRIDWTNIACLVGVTVLIVWLQRKAAQPDFFVMARARAGRLLETIMGDEPEVSIPHDWLRDLYDGTR